jgi:hypothetical protein
MRTVVFSLSVGTLAASLCLVSSAAAAQHLPAVPSDECRSEMDGRLAFGLCPENTFDFYATGVYRDGVPRPEDVLGYPIGSWHTTYGRMERYLDALSAAAEDRVRVFDYGKSVEQQTMYLVVVSSEENIAHLDEIRDKLQRLANPRRTAPSEVAAIIAATPIVVWLNAANDGNETAAFEAAMQVAYQLAAGEDERTRLLRDSAITIINLAHNPESHERHVAWYNAFVSGDPDPAALEHRAPWGMSTNNNHYQFDLNRDALGLTQTETRAVAAELQRWRPQVFVDLHGQTTQFFFPPAAMPVMPLYPPSLKEWLDVFGRGNAAAFDQFGWSYYTRDRFDLFYPGYWDTYPALHGATGMTYETDGGGGKGVRWRRDDGTVLTFADGIAHHFVASLATVETAARNRTARLGSYYEYFQLALQQAGGSQIRTVIFVSESNPSRAARLAVTLLRHGIQVGRPGRRVRAAVTSYLSGEQRQLDVPQAAYVVDLAQPNGRLAATLLAPDIPLTDEYAAQELTRFARNARRSPDEQERYTFYDVTAWNLLLASGVNGYWSKQALDLETAPLALAEEMVKAPGGWESEHLAMEGGVTGRARSAYVWTSGDRGSYRVLARLLDEGFNVAVAARAIVVDGRAYPRGTLVARVGRNREELHQRIDVLAREAGISVTPAQSAFPDRGQAGTGSEDTRSIKPPRVAVLAGDGVRITSYGHLWFELERRIGYPFTALRTTDFRRASLGQFDVLVIPDGSFERTIGERGTEKLKAWVERGGTLVAYGSGADFVMDNDLGTSHAEPDTTRLPADTISAILRTIDAAAPAGSVVPPLPSPDARPNLPQRVPGSFLRGRIDRTHWLTIGHEGDEVPLLMRSLPLRASRSGANPVVFASGDRLVIAGFSWPDNTVRTYAGQPYATVDTVGEGRVILFAEDPLYRGIYDAGANLLLNAIFFGAPPRRDADYK